MGRNVKNASKKDENVRMKRKRVKIIAKRQNLIQMRGKHRQKKEVRDMHGFS
jgi:hypothetical protein